MERFSKKFYGENNVRLEGKAATLVMGCGGAAHVASCITAISAVQKAGAAFVFSGWQASSSGMTIASFSPNHPHPP